MTYRVVRCYDWESLHLMHFTSWRIISIQPIEKVHIEASKERYRCYDFDYIVILETDAVE